MVKGQVRDRAGVAHVDGGRTGACVRTAAGPDAWSGGAGGVRALPREAAVTSTRPRAAG